MKSLLVALLLAAAPAAALAESTPPPPEVAGDWQGVLKLADATLPFVIHFGAKVTADSPTESEFGRPAQLERTGDAYKVSLEGGGVLEAKLTQVGRMQGTFSKDGVTTPVTLERKTAAK